MRAPQAQLSGSSTLPEFHIVRKHDRITATEAARDFSDLLNRAVYRRESFEVEHGGQIVAIVSPAPASGSLRDLALELRQQGHTPVPGFDDAMAEARTYGAEKPEDP